MINTTIIEPAMDMQEPNHSTCESYIVHIYRRNMDDPQELVGTIEDVMKGYKQSFNTLQSLLECLLQNDNKRNEQ